MAWTRIYGIGGRIALLIGILVLTLVGLPTVELLMSDQALRKDRGHTTRRLVEEAQSLLHHYADIEQAG